MSRPSSVGWRIHRPRNWQRPGLCCPDRLGLRDRRPGLRHDPSVTIAFLPKGYEELLGQLKERIRSAQLRAGLAVNRELIELYWQIGRSVVERQRSDGWGKSIVERLAQDIQSELAQTQH